MTFLSLKNKLYFICRKIIGYGISVTKISTYVLPGQTLEEITNIFHQFNAWKLSRYYRDILHHFELSWNYRDKWKKHYRSGVVLRSFSWWNFSVQPCDMQCSFLPPRRFRWRHIPQLVPWQKWSWVVDIIDSTKFNWFIMINLIFTCRLRFVADQILSRMISGAFFSQD